jgi:uncharacterized membrane protein YozB (DUF420 family)
MFNFLLIKDLVISPHIAFMLLAAVIILTILVCYFDVKQNKRRND